MTLMVAETGRDDIAEPAPVRRDPPVELVLGLQLLRASSLTSTRLQLALTRRDRRGAMAALDTLAAVDSEIEGLVDRLSTSGASSPELAAIGAWLAQEKEAVTADKLTLACEVSGPGLVSPPDRLSESAYADPAAASSAREAVPDLDGASAIAEEPAPARRRWLLVAFAVMVAVLAAGAVIAFMLPSDELPPMLAEASRRIGLRWP